MVISPVARFPTMRRHLTVLRFPANPRLPSPRSGPCPQRNKSANSASRVFPAQQSCPQRNKSGHQRNNPVSPARQECPQRNNPCPQRNNTVSLAQQKYPRRGNLVLPVLSSDLTIFRACFCDKKPRFGDIQRRFGPFAKCSYSSRTAFDLSGIRLEYCRGYPAYLRASHGDR